ncbi:MAG: hypothetical protein DLM57_16535 [Pseudonocardiales bacterium]|nr:MAG: hypothetical protein DLM57_16535 [Pseudonocardiales bacterium]
MLAAVELYGPVRYRWYWLPLGIGLLVLVAAWYGYVFWTTRTDRTARPRAARPRDLAATRSRYHEWIADVGRHAHSGTMSVRVAHQRLSELVRGYVAETSSVPAASMTLRELHAAETASPQMRPVTTAIGVFYPSEFDYDSRGDPAAAVAIAHQVVETLP